MRQVCILFSSFIFSFLAHADLETQNALGAVQAQMRDVDAFKRTTGANNPNAISTQKNIEMIAGSPETEKDIYKLAADILGNMKDLTPEQMQQVLEKAQKDPAGFAATFSPEQRKKLEQVAERTPAAKYKRP